MVTANAFASDGIKWHKYEEGMKSGKNSQKKVFLFFYSDFCRYCKEMESKTFKNTSVIDAVNNNFIPVKVNTDKEQNIAEEYGVRGLPSIFFISEKGEITNKYPGYIPSDMLLIALKHVYTDSYKTMSLKSYMNSISSSEK
uniref:Thioredoxin domain-containing protein n=1 Tax=uncultured Desulfobacterium sp. TaxID=201089 RepID=E1Y9W8_9BACT|nr:hypothetical protein N47_H21840 [uncultured Desulfobacterium sp.]